MHDLLGSAFPYRAVVAVHVLSAFAFVLLHGGSALVALRLRRERRLESVRTLLTLSGESVGWAYAALMVLGLSGLALAAYAHAWRQTWIWGSALALFVLVGAMAALGGEPMRQARRSAGIPPPDRRDEPPSPADEPAMRAALDRFRGGWLFAVGIAGLALLVWLMVARPA